MVQARVNHKWLLASLTAVLAAAAGLAGRGRLSTTKGEVVTGSIEPVITLAASRSGGLVKEVMVHEGDLVSEGQILVRFDTAELESRRKELLSSIGALKKGIENHKAFAELPSNLQNLLRDSHPDVAKSEEAYVRALADFDGASPHERAAAKVRLNLAAQERMTARRKVDAAIANTGGQTGTELVAVLNARLAEIDGLIGESDVRSPSDGVVDLLKLRDGDRVLPSAPVAALAVPNAYFSELVVGRIPLGDACKATLEDRRVLDCRIESTSTRTIPPVLRETRDNSQEIVTHIAIHTDQKIPVGARARFELP